MIVVTALGVARVYAKDVLLTILRCVQTGTVTLANLHMMVQHQLLKMQPTKVMARSQFTVMNVDSPFLWDAKHVAPCAICTCVTKVKRSIRLLMD
mgnify:CR=1 FL=1